MPNDIPGFKKFYAAFRARMTHSETTNGDYSVVNDTPQGKGKKPTYAMGKYQFVPSIWMSKIKSFSEKQGFGKVDKDSFLKMPKLQEAFFEHYAKTVVYPKAIELAKNDNKRNLDVDEIGQLVHMNNSGNHVKTYLSGGDFPVGGVNMKPKKYLEKGKLGLDSNQISRVTKADIMSVEEKREKINNYFIEKDQIKNSDYHEDAKKLQIRSLNDKYNGIGLIREINERITSQTKGQEIAFKNGKASFESLYNIFEESTQNDDSVKLKRSGKKAYVDALFKTKKAKEVLKMMQERYPGMIKVQKYKEGKNEYDRLNFRLDEKDSTAKFLAENIKKYNGLDVFAQENGLESIFKENFINIPEKKFGFNATKQFYGNLGESSTKKLDFNKEFEYPEDGRIEAKDLSPLEKNLENDFKEVVKEEPLISEEEEQAIDAKIVEVANTEEQNNLANFLNEEMPLEVPDDLNYNKDDFDKQLPFDAVAAGLVGLVGLSRGDNPIPKRDERVSAGVEDYVAKMGEIAKMGLPADVEAEAKNKIAAGYQMGLKNLVEASAGNRNLVLGNQASLDLSSMLATSQIGIEDFKAKNQALKEYGQGAMYINEFNSNRDIANKQLEQDLAIDKNRQAEGLAESGFASMISSLQAARENAPGSARHMLSSLVRQNAFGYDPEMKDDGEGTTKGTRSWYQKNVVDKTKGYNDNLKFLQEQYNSFDKEKQNFMNLVYGKTQNVDKLTKAAEFASQGNFQTGDESALSNAVLNDDYQSLRKYNELPETKTENASNLTDYLNRA